MARLYFDKRWVPASLYLVFHVDLLNLLEVVGAKKNTCRFPECSLKAVLIVSAV